MWHFLYIVPSSVCLLVLTPSQVCSHYVAQLWILPPNYAIFGPPAVVAPGQVPNILKHIALSSGAEAIFKSNCFEFHGTEASIRSALLTTFDLDPVRAQPSSVRVQIELAAEHRDFLAGKKDGKVNKIMKSTSVRCVDMFGEHTSS